MTKNNINKIRNSLIKRHRREQRFKRMGRCAIALSILFILIMFVDIAIKGYRSFYQTQIQLMVDYPDINEVDLESDPELLKINWDIEGLKNIVSNTNHYKDDRLVLAFREVFSESIGWQIRDELIKTPSLSNTQGVLWVRASSPVDIRMKYGFDEAPLSSIYEQILNDLKELNKIRVVFNQEFFTSGVSQNPEEVGIGGALKGTLLMLTVTLVASFPIGVATAIYLEEFAPKNKISDFLEANINNLAAVPPVIFGLLGLAVFLQLFGLPRSAPIVGGLVLSLMTMPTIIIAARASIKAFPPSLRDAALAMGASQTQVVFHHILPFAMPGILTGSIIGMALALGETAPLIMIGMVAFIVDIPTELTDPAAALPVQIFLWSDAPERGFLEKTSGAILVLLGVLVAMNTAAVILRRRLEKKFK